MISEVARNYLNELERDLDWLRANVSADEDDKRQVAAHVAVWSESGNLDHIGNGEQCDNLNLAAFTYDVAWIEINPEDFNESEIIEALVAAFEDAFDRTEAGQSDALADKLDWDARMRRQADSYRVILADATPDDPITLSPELYDKIAPHNRGGFLRG